MAANICQISICLEKLIVCYTETEAEVGDLFLQSMHDAENLNNLELIALFGNEKWFGGR